MLNKIGKIIAPLPLRLLGALVASSGFLLMAFRLEMKITGSALIGIGTTIMAAGDK